jgi:hypothetical protein
MVTSSDREPTVEEREAKHMSLRLASVPRDAAEVHLGGWGLAVVPPDLAHFRALRILDLSFNGLRDYSAFTALSETLEELDLSNNELAALPPALAGLPQLRRLRATANTVSELPAALCEALERLEGLWLDNNALEALPDAIASLSHLQVLSVPNNRLDVLPEAVGALPLTSLVVSGNHLASLPDALASCTALETLLVSHNRLTALPSVASLPSLAQLDVAANPLVEPRIHELGPHALLRFARLARTDGPDVGAADLAAVAALPASSSALAAPSLRAGPCTAGGRDATLVVAAEGADTGHAALRIAAATAPAQWRRDFAAPFLFAEHATAAGGRPYALCPPARGRPLDDLLREGTGRTWPLAFRLRVAVGLAQALCRLADQHMHHCALSPRCVFVDAAGEVQVGDLFLAKHNPACNFGNAVVSRADAMRLRAQEAVALAPEVVAEGRFSRASDVFAVGHVLLQLFLARPVAFASDPAALVALARPLPDPLRARIVRCWAETPRRRGSPAALAEALMSLERDEVDSAALAGPSPQPWIDESP